MLPVTAGGSTSADGTKLPNRDVRCLVAIGGKADIGRTAHSGRDLPVSDIGYALR